MNLNELHLPDDNVDEAVDWAIIREFVLREDSYAQAKLWGVTEIVAPASVARFFCADPEREWVKDQMREVYDLSDPKHPDWHSIHVDLYDQREGK